METNPERSLLLATESIRITRQVNGAVLSLSNIALRQSIIKSRVRLTLKGHEEPVNSASYSPGWPAAGIQSKYGMLLRAKN